MFQPGGDHLWLLNKFGHSHEFGLATSRIKAYQGLPRSPQASNRPPGPNSVIWVPCLVLWVLFFSVQKENHQFRGRLEKDTTVYVIHLKALTGPKGTGLMLIWKTHGSMALCPEKLLKDFSNPFR